MGYLAACVERMMRAADGQVPPIGHGTASHSGHPRTGAFSGFEDTLPTVGDVAVETVRSSPPRVRPRPFVGTYSHVIDDKHRLVIPARIRECLDTTVHGEGFYLLPRPDGALSLWPERTYERQAREIEPSLNSPPEQIRQAEEIFSAARLVEIDTTGRVLLPHDMLAAVGIGTRVVVRGLGNHLQLRGPESGPRPRQEQTAGG